jgi:hypothetical protein
VLEIKLLLPCTSASQHISRAPTITTTSFTWQCASTPTNPTPLPSSIERLQWNLWSCYVMQIYLKWCFNINIISCTYGVSALSSVEVSNLKHRIVQSYYTIDIDLSHILRFIPKEWKVAHSNANGGLRSPFCARLSMLLLFTLLRSGELSDLLSTTGSCQPDNGTDHTHHYSLLG